MVYFMLNGQGFKSLHVEGFFLSVFPERPEGHPFRPPDVRQQIGNGKTSFPGDLQSLHADDFGVDENDQTMAGAGAGAGSATLGVESVFAWEAPASPVCPAG